MQGSLSLAANFLLIDDDSFTLDLLAHQFRALGFSQFSKCIDAKAALDLLRCEGAAFDLLFCDLQMPNMDGVELIRELAAMDCTCGVVLMSGEDRQILHATESLAKALGLRVVGTLSKPISMDQLQIIIERSAKNITAAISKKRDVVYSADELQGAIDNGQMINHYQPKVDLQTGQLVGVESLVRWRHPQHGLIYPDQFIVALEEYGLVNNLTRVVTANALQQLGVWRKSGLELSVAVNVSMDNLRYVRFADWILGMLKKFCIPAEALVLEVTESKLMDDLAVPLDILTRLRLNKVGVAIDDFGTGHSSLVQLHELPFSELKVDRAFVNGAAHDHTLRAIVEGSINMARQLGIKIVAEGVETHDDWRFLSSADCDMAQGYFIAKPMSPEKLLIWLMDWKQRAKLLRE